MTSSTSGKGLLKRSAALTSWAKTTDRAARTAPARKAAFERFEKQIREQHPDLDDATVIQMAEAARKAWMLKLAAKSAETRAARKGRR